MVNRLASILGFLLALTIALLVAVGLGVSAYALTTPGFGLQNLAAKSQGTGSVPSAEFIFFSIFAFAYLLWATLPLSIGSSRQFDPGNLLLYPISLRKLFAVDFTSEIASLQSVFAVPAVLAIGIGVGLGTRNMIGALLLAFAAVLFGLALSKWVSTSIGALIRKKRTRGETLLALVGAIAGLGGALFGQIAPALFRHSESVTALRWTPPGAIAFGLTGGLRDGQTAGYLLALFALLGYSVVLIVITFWLERRAILGGGQTKRKRRPTLKTTPEENYVGWSLPVISAELSAVIEKELRYLTRNAQLRMMTLMPLILIVIRVVNSKRFGSGGGDRPEMASEFVSYADGLLATGGMLYVFLILSGLYCNQFAFEAGGMRTLVLSPVDRTRILIGKNVAITAVALVFCTGLLAINQLVFGDIGATALLFAIFSFISFAVLMSLMGNWFSVRFPKPMKFGKRLNVAGVVGLMIIPMILVLALIPVASVAAGYVARSLLVEYVTLGVLSLTSIGFYLLVIKSQGEAFQQRELEILETINDPEQ